MLPSPPDMKMFKTNHSYSHIRNKKRRNLRTKAAWRVYQKALKAFAAAHAPMIERMLRQTSTARAIFGIDLGSGSSISVTTGNECKIISND